LEEDKEKKARAKAAARQAGGSVFSKLTGKINAAKASPEAKKRLAALEKRVDSLEKKMTGNKFNTPEERDEYVDVYNAWVDAMRASGNNNKSYDKIVADGALGWKFESVEMDTEILKAMIYKEFVNYTTESEFDYLDSLVESGRNILNELAVETYTPVMNTIEKAYIEGTIDKYQYDDLCIATFERMNDEYLICD
jgi:transcription elongation factor Elf1